MLNGTKSARLIIRRICFSWKYKLEKKNVFFFVKLENLYNILSKFKNSEKHRQHVEGLVEFKNCRTKKLLQTADTEIASKKTLESKDSKASQILKTIWNPSHLGKGTWIFFKDNPLQWRYFKKKKRKQFRHNFSARE